MMTLTDYLYDINNEIVEMDQCLVRMLIPLTLNVAGGKVKLSETEKADFQKSYKNLKILYENTINICKKFFNALKQADYPIGAIESKHKNFTTIADKQISATIELCENIIMYPEGLSSKEQALLENAYFAYLIVVRCFNSFIRFYNEKKPDHKIDELKSIPDPKYLDELFNLSDFISECDTFEKLLQYYNNTFLK